MRSRRLIQTVDSHTEGNPTRVIIGGVAVPPGATLRERCDWLRTHDDQLRQLLNFEPRGSAMMCSAIVMPPLEGGDFSVLLMEQDEYVPMCGHCMIGVATTLVETGMVPPSESLLELTFETLAGAVKARVRIEEDSVRDVTLVNVGSFVVAPGATLRTRDYGDVAADIAFGGDFYAIVDADALGLELSPSSESEAARAAAQIIAAVNDQVPIAHPDDPAITRCYETLFTTNRTTRGDFRHAVISPPGAYDRSPCGTGTSARLALMYANGQIGIAQPARFEGLLGTYFEAAIERVEQKGTRTVVHPVITGRAFLTGFHSFLLDAHDPFPRGYRIGPPAREQG